MREIEDSDTFYKKNKLLEVTSSAVAITNSSGEIIDFSSSFSDLFKQEPQTLLKRSIYSFFVKEKIRYYKKQFGSFFSAKTTFHDAVVCITPDMTSQVLLLTIIPLQSTEKENTFFMYLFGENTTLCSDTIDLKVKRYKEQEEKRFRSLLENSSDAIATISKEGKILYVSPTIEKVLGYSMQEYLEMTPPHIIHPEDIILFTNIFPVVLAQEGETFSITCRALHKSGVYRWLDLTLMNRLSDPSVSAIIINFRDITQKKQIQERQDFMEKLNTILLSSLDHQVIQNELGKLIVPQLADYCRIVLLNDNDEIQDILVKHYLPGKVKLVKDLYTTYTGRSNIIYGVDHILKTGKPEIIHNIQVDIDPDTYRNIAGMKQVISSLELKSYMGVPLIAHDKICGAITFSSIIPYRYYTKEDLLFAEEIAQRVAIILDNSRLYEKAQKNENYFRFLAESIPTKIFTATSQGNIDYANKQWLEFSGLSLEEIQTSGLQGILHPEDLKRTKRQWQKSVALRLPFQSEQRFKRTDGSYYWHLTRAQPVLDTHGNITMWIGSNTDIDQQKSLESRKNEFISMASHELKTPVTSLTAYTQVLEKRFRKQGNKEEVVYLERMDRQLQKLTNLISDLLDVSRIQAGKMQYKKDVFAIYPLVKDTIEEIQAIDDKHDIIVNGKTEAFILGDKERIGQIIINLLTNAIKYSPENTTIVVSLATEGSFIRISVEDEGIGIREEEQKKIFERFYQVTDLQEKTYPGLGMGLYIAYDIARRHKGKLTVISKKGKGSTFTLTLPLQKSLF